MTLTISEIKELAEFAGFVIQPFNEGDDRDSTITICDCPAKGVKDDDGNVSHYRLIAYYEEYPEEGVFPLGDKSSEGRDK